MASDGLFTIQCANCQRMRRADKLLCEFCEAKKEDKALRYNEGKTRWSLVHFPSLEPMVEVLEFGAKKYDEENWKKPMEKRQILNSAMRHLIKLMEGIEQDEESGLPEVGHLMCNIMFYAYHSRINPYQK